MRIFTLLLGLLPLWGCSGGLPMGPDPAPVRAALDEAFAVRLGQEARIEGESLRLLFRSVPEDSRCPAEVNCVWEGNARVRIEVVKPPHARRTVEIATTLDPRRASYLEYEIRLVSLAPIPSAGVPTDPERYVAELLVTRRSGTSGSD